MANDKDPQVSAQVASEAETRESVDAKLESSEKMLETIKAIHSQAKAAGKDLKDLNNELVKYTLGHIKALEDKKEALLKLGDKEGVEDVIKQIKKLNGEVEQLNKKIITIGETIENELGEKFKKTIEEAGQIITNKLFKPISAGAVLEAIPALDKLRAEFIRNTAASDEFANKITSLQGKLINLGLSTAETSKIYQASYLNFNRFSLETDKTREKIVDLTAQFYKLGVPPEQLNESLSQTMTTFGLTADEAMKYQVDIGNAGRALNMTMGDMNSKFLSNMKNLSIYGKGAFEQFEKLSAVTKATKVEVSSLLDINERLATFEGSAEFAGRINALAGRDVFDAVKLATLEGEDRIQYLRQGLSSLDLSRMPASMLRAYTKAAGIDAQQLQQLGGMGGADIGALKAKIEQRKGEGIAGLGGRAEAATTQEEKLLAVQEKSRNETIKSTDAMSAYNKIMGIATKTTGLFSGVVATAFGSLGSFVIPIVSRNLLTWSLNPTGGGGAGSAITRMGAGGGPLGRFGGAAGRAGARIGGGAALGLAGLGIETLSEGTRFEEEGLVAGSVLEGAGTGFLFGGPVGALVGAGVGALLGTYRLSEKRSKVSDAQGDLRTGLSAMAQGSLEPKGLRNVEADPKDTITISQGKVDIGTNLGKANSDSMLSSKAIELLQKIADNTYATNKNTQPDAYSLGRRGNTGNSTLSIG